MLIHDDLDDINDVSPKPQKIKSDAVKTASLTTNYLQ